MMSEQDMDAINSGDESDHDLVSTEMLDPFLKMCERNYIVSLFF